MRLFSNMSLETHFHWDMEANIHCSLLTKKRKRTKSWMLPQSTNAQIFFCCCFSRHLCSSQILRSILNVNINSLYCLFFGIRFSFPDQNLIQRQTKNTTKLKKESPFHPRNCHASFLHTGKQWAVLFSDAFCSLCILSVREKISVILNK